MTANRAKDRLFLLATAVVGLVFLMAVIFGPESESSDELPPNLSTTPSENEDSEDGERDERSDGLRSRWAVFPLVTVIVVENDDGQLQPASTTTTTTATTAPPTTQTPPPTTTTEPPPPPPPDQEDEICFLAMVCLEQEQPHDTECPPGRHSSCETDHPEPQSPDRSPGMQVPSIRTGKQG